jgi:hypothetical protein
MANWENILIKKAINHYKYTGGVDDCTSVFIDEYNFFARKENLKKYISTVWSTLGSIPTCTHIAAKNLLFQKNDLCWKYFERTALFWTMSHINDPWIDHLKGALEYSLYVERKDLVEILIKKCEEYLNREEYKTSKDYIKQKVYPSTQLIHFLFEKWMGVNPVKDRVLQYGSGYGIYQKLIDNWEDLTKVESSYWDELCEYHLRGLGLEKQDDYKTEEFLTSGLVPMELINVMKVRSKLGLDTPKINHELFKTPMTKEPQIPTGYDENIDVKFQMVKRTVEKKKKYTITEIEDELSKEFGASAQLFF